MSWLPSFRAEYGRSYAEMLSEAERAEAALLAEIRRKAEANEARARAYATHGHVLAMDRPGHAL